MAWFLARRMLWIALTLWAVFTASFILMRVVPGGPFDAERQIEPEIRANFERRYNLDQPPVVQYYRELGRLLTFDFGYSMKLLDFSVADVIRQGFPVSASLGLTSLSLALIVGVGAGIISALCRGTAADVAVMTLATVGIALPNFVIAGFSVLAFVFVIPLLPAAGWGSPAQMILPALCLAAPYAAYIARLVRTGMLDVLSQDYIRTARAKGLSRQTVIFKHALRGALLPLVSFLGPATAGILTGSLVVEKIFFIPGLSVHFINAATQRDHTLSMGVVLCYTALLQAMNLLVDLAYAVLDPRITLK